MACITVPLDKKLKNRIKKYPWINWSEVAREEVLKKEIFETYLKTKKISDEDWAFCEKIDWHPVDELPLKKEYIKKLEKARKEKPVRLKSVEDLFS